MSQTEPKKRPLDGQDNTPNKICRIESLHQADENNLLYHLDVLPYFDPSYGLDNMPTEQQVTSLLRSEMKLTPFKLENYLPLVGDYIVTDFKVSIFLMNQYSWCEGTTFLENEFKRITGVTKITDKGIDTTKYEVSPPATNKKNDINAWKTALSNAKSQYQSLLLR